MALLQGEILDEHGASIGEIHRSLSPAAGVAQHGYLHLKDTRSIETAKHVLRANITYYRQLGLSRVEMYVGLDRGGYAWAKYGFGPPRDSWAALRPLLRIRTGTTASPKNTNLRGYGGEGSPTDSLIRVRALRDRIGVPALNIATSDRQAMLDLVESDDPRTIWDIADSRIPVRVIDGTLPLGKLLLSGTSWKASLDLNDASALRRFDGYFGPAT